MAGTPAARGTCSAAFVAEPSRQRRVPGLGGIQKNFHLSPSPKRAEGSQSLLFSSSDLDLGADLQRPIRGHALRKDGPVVPQSAREKRRARA